LVISVTTIEALVLFLFLFCWHQKSHNIMADPPHVPPPIPPPPPAAAASSRPKRKRSWKTDPRDSPGALVHALAHNVMGKNAAALMFGNRNYDKTFISGQVISVFDSKKPNAKNSQWSLRVLWNIAGHPSGKEYTILRQHTKLGPVPVGINPQSSSTYADSLNVRDSQSVRGSTTYIPNAMGVAAQMDSSNLSVANSQQMLTGGGNPGGNNDGTSHVHTGDSGDRNSIEADMSGDNGSNLSSTTATTNASSMVRPWRSLCEQGFASLRCNG